MSPVSYETKPSRYAYRMTCGDVFVGPKGLNEGDAGVCAFHGPDRLAGFGIRLASFLRPRAESLPQDISLGK